MKAFGIIYNSDILNRLNEAAKKLKDRRAEMKKECYQQNQPDRGPSVPF